MDNRGVAMRVSDKDRWKGIASIGLFMTIAIGILIIVLGICATIGLYM